MKKVLFIDRDGTLILETDNYKIDVLEKVKFYPEVFYWLGKIVREFDYELVLVTNQDGLGTSDFPNEPFYSTHKFIMQCFADEKIIFTKEHIDVTYFHENKSTRKPGIGMMGEYFDGSYDLKNSFMIGDRITDVEFAKNMGCQCFWLNNGSNLGIKEIKNLDELQPSIAVESTDWSAIYNFLKAINV